MATAGTGSNQARSNPELAEAGWPPAVIGGAYQTGVLGVRSLKRRGVRAVMVDCAPDNNGFHSVWGPARLCPDPDVDGPGWVAFMVALARELGARPVLIPSSDRYITAVANNLEALAPHGGPWFALVGRGVALGRFVAQSCGPGRGYRGFGALVTGTVAA